MIHDDLAPGSRSQPSFPCLPGRHVMKTPRKTLRGSSVAAIVLAITLFACNSDDFSNAGVIDAETGRVSRVQRDDRVPRGDRATEVLNAAAVVCAVAGDRAVVNGRHA